MAELIPATRVLLTANKTDADGWDNPDHDGIPSRIFTSCCSPGGIGGDASARKSKMPGLAAGHFLDRDVLAPVR